MAASRPWLIDATGGLSRREVLACAVRAAGQLPRGRVIVATSSVRATVIATLAAWYAGASPTLVGTRAGAAGISPMIHAKDCPTTVLTDDPALPNGVLVETLTGPARHGRPRRVLARRPLPVLHTSGSTGPPRAVPVALGQVALRQYASVVRRLPQIGRIGLALPPTHGHGAAAVSATWLLGRQLVDLHRLPVGEARELLVDAEAEAITGLPEQALGLAAPGIRTAVCGSAPMAADTCQALLTAYDHLVNIYGSTETGPIALANTADLRTVPGCVGRPVAGVRVSVEDGVIRVRRGRTTFAEDRGHFEQGLLVIDGRVDARPQRRGEVPDTERALRWLADRLKAPVDSRWAGEFWTVTVAGGVEDPVALRALMLVELGPRDTPDEITGRP